MTLSHFLKDTALTALAAALSFAALPAEEAKAHVSGAENSADIKKARQKVRAAARQKAEQTRSPAPQRHARPNRGAQYAQSRPASPPRPAARRSQSSPHTRMHVDTAPLRRAEEFRPRSRRTQPHPERHIERGRDRRAETREGRTDRRTHRYGNRGHADRGHRDRKHADRHKNHRTQRHAYRHGYRDAQRNHHYHNHHYRSGHRYNGHRRWDRWAWRQHKRYNWYNHRQANRHIFRLGRYYSPYRGHHYRRFSVGFSLDGLFFSSRYWVNNPGHYRLPEVYGPYRWIRYYNDVALVNIYTGEVVDVIHNFFW